MVTLVEGSPLSGTKPQLPLTVDPEIIRPLRELVDPGLDAAGSWAFFLCGKNLAIRAEPFDALERPPGILF